MMMFVIVNGTWTGISFIVPYCPLWKQEDFEKQLKIKETPHRNTASEKPIAIFSNMNFGKELLFYFCSLTSFEMIFKSVSVEKT